LVAFSERLGGVSAPPFGPLNLAAHVGDDPEAVDENRSRLLRAVGLGSVRACLTMADQVHGDRIAVVDAAHAGAGAFANHGMPPIAATDAIVTAETDVPLALCFADCVPVVLTAPGGEVAVAHAGWRGALAGIAGATARKLAEVAACAPCELTAYIGPHIAACHYEVDAELMSRFCTTFGAVARADSGGLDLDACVTASLVDTGVALGSIVRLGTCTAEATDRFYSHRAEDGRTGRHVALGCRTDGLFANPMDSHAEDSLTGRSGGGVI
jgi:YfiH family protein